MIFDAGTLARGWLAVALASGTDKDSAALHKTIHVEEHMGGVMLIATDRYVMLRTWVPDVDHDRSWEPQPDEAPDHVATVIDDGDRASKLFGYALKLARQAAKDELDPLRVELRVGVPDTSGMSDGSFPGMEARATIVNRRPHQLDHGTERLSLTCYEGEWIDWRRVLRKVRPAKTEQIVVNPRIVGRLAGIGSIMPGAQLGFVFSEGREGKPGPIRVEVLDSDPYVSGVAMPVRWDFEAWSPADEAAARVQDTGPSGGLDEVAPEDALGEVGEFEAAADDQGTDDGTP